MTKETVLDYVNKYGAQIRNHAASIRNTSLEAKNPEVLALDGKDDFFNTLPSELKNEIIQYGRRERMDFNNTYNGLEAIDVDKTKVVKLVDSLYKSENIKIKPAIYIKTSVTPKDIMNEIKKYEELSIQYAEGADIDDPHFDFSKGFLSKITYGLDKDLQNKIERYARDTAYNHIAAKEGKLLCETNLDDIKNDIINICDKDGNIEIFYTYDRVEAMVSIDKYADICVAAGNKQEKIDAYVSTLKKDDFFFQIPDNLKLSIDSYIMTSKHNMHLQMMDSPEREEVDFTYIKDLENLVVTTTQEKKNEVLKNQSPTKQENLEK